MSYFSSMLVVVVIGMAVLMAGILVDRQPGQDFRHALYDSMAWGIGFLVSFGSEFMLLALS